MNAKSPLTINDNLAKIIAEYKDIPWMKPDGKPDPSWKLFTAPGLRDAQAAAHRAAMAACGPRGDAWDGAWDPTGGAPWDGAWDAAMAAARAAVRGSSRHAALAAALAATRDFEWDAAWDANGALRDVTGDITLDVVVRGVCGGLPIAKKHRDHIAARMEVWRKGYCLLCDVDGELYVYAVATR